MMDTTDVDRFEPYIDEGNREGYGQMELCENGDWVRATDYDALAAKLAEADAMIEAQQKDYASNNVRFAEAEYRAKVAEAKLAEVEAERDAAIKWAKTEHANADRYAARADAAEARIAHLENHIEGVAKDTHKIMVAYEAALPAVYRLALEDAAGQCKTHFIDAGPTARREHKAGEDIAAAIRSTPTPTAAELMARINEGEKE